MMEAPVPVAATLSAAGISSPELAQNGTCDQLP
jgi:hypothetical protein